MVDSREPVAVAATPSHALSGWRASALSAQPLPLDAGASVLLRNGEAWLPLAAGASVPINGEPVTADRRLAAGPRFRVTGAAGDWRPAARGGGDVGGSSCRFRCAPYTLIHKKQNN